MERLSKEQEIIKVLFKDFLTPYNSRSVSKKIGISHVGAFKILKKLEKRDIVKAKRIGKAVIYSLNKDNPVALREIEMSLTIEAQNYKRWIEDFNSLKDKTKFAILFGSITRNKEKAKDIDLLIVANKNRFKEIRKIVNQKNAILSKKIHLILQTFDEFEADVKKKNKAIVEIIKTGIILFRQEEINKIMKGIEVF